MFYNKYFHFQICHMLMCHINVDQLLQSVWLFTFQRLSSTCHPAKQRGLMGYSFESLYVAINIAQILVNLSKIKILSLEISPVMTD